MRKHPRRAAVQAQRRNKMDRLTNRLRVARREVPLGSVNSDDLSEIFDAEVKAAIASTAGSIEEHIGRRGHLATLF
jgi:hypothetical protein